MTRRLRPPDRLPLRAAARRRRLALAVTAVLAAGVSAAGKATKSELQQDLRDEALVGDWIYDDIDAGFARAVRERKPVCVVFR